MVGVELYDVNLMIQVIHECNGLLTDTAKRIGCSTRTLDRYAREYPEVREAIEEERRALVDLAESSLIKALKGQEPWAVQLVLRTLGKDRGYVESREIKGTFEHEVRAKPMLREVVVELPRLAEEPAPKDATRLPGAPRDDGRVPAVIDAQAREVS